MRVTVREIGREADLPQSLDGTGAGFGAGETGLEGGERAADDAGEGHARIEGGDRVLEDDLHLGPAAAQRGGEVRDVLPVIGDGARPGLRVAADGHHQGGLPGPRRSPDHREQGRVQSGESRQHVVVQLPHRATHPVEGGTADTVPYGENFQAPYATTKTIAEKAVL